MTIHRERCDLVDVTREIVHHFDAQAAMVGTRFELDLPPRVAGDWDRARWSR